MNRLVRGYKTICQVGLVPVLQVGLYRLGLLSGHYRRVTKPGCAPIKSDEARWLINSPSLENSGLSDFYKKNPKLETDCRKKAESILQGTCLIFGDQPAVVLNEKLDVSHHWTDYESKKVPLPVEDIKFIWEPARLGWVFELGRWAAFGKDELLGMRSWGLMGKFIQANPVNCGPNWMNGQEIALRILAMAFFHEVFRADPHLPENWEQILAQSVIDHARRIPPTLVYARSQNNNHLLVEAAGLYTAGVILPAYHESDRWRKIGWQIFHQALQDQIEDDGTYAQYSTNYHRLLLQSALWMKAIATRNNENFPVESHQKLAAATNWLSGLMVSETGRVPNYGHNDGAYIIPLTGKPYDDYRPVVSASQHFFFPASITNPAEDENEMTLWFRWLAAGKMENPQFSPSISPVRSYQKLQKGKLSAILFAPSIQRRPGQADLLSLDIRSKGIPVVLDAGTYRYNAAPPWDNALASTRVHNTISLNENDQMLRMGRFLWLDWPEVKWEGNGSNTGQMAASHNGYRRLGVVHKRTVSMDNEKVCRVVDEVSPEKPTGWHQLLDVYVHWLLPDIDWMMTPTGLMSKKTAWQINFQTIPQDDGDSPQVEYQLIRAGQLIYSSKGGDVPAEDLINLGWYSPTYGMKVPAISYRIILRDRMSIQCQTEFVV